jgi:hypothetical protein
MTAVILKLFPCQKCGVLASVLSVDVEIVNHYAVFLTD